MSFEKLGLSEELVKAVEKMGFTEPTPIQDKAIPEIIDGNRDLVGLAQTGTGKTAAFGLPMIQLIDFQSKHTQGIVICPTRELCIQISKDYHEYSRYIKGAKVCAVYGGTSISNQISQIKRGVQIIVATPGRLLDLINRRVVKLGNISYVVLDEADEMLNMGFQEDLDAILAKTPDDKRTWLFSATMPREVAKIAKKYMTDPYEITVGRKNSGAANIDHVNYIINERDRYQALKRVIDFYPRIFGLVFCRTRKETQDIAELLMKDGYNAEALHGDLSQGQRDKVMRRFRGKNLQLLVATDVAARGIDVQDISHVINYRLPDEVENYTHRSGRTARAGKSGVSIVLMNSREHGKLRATEKKAGIKFKHEQVPNGYGICENQLFAMVEKLVQVDVDTHEIEKFLPPVLEALEGLSKEELIQKVVSQEFNRFLSYYKDSADINYTPKFKDRERRTGKRTGKKGTSNLGSAKTSRFFLNMGKVDELNPGAVVRLLCDQAKIRSGQVGSIDIMREFSFFEVDAKIADIVVKRMKNAQLDGRTVRVEPAEQKKSKTYGGKRSGGKKSGSKKENEDK